LVVLVVLLVVVVVVLLVLLVGVSEIETRMCETCCLRYFYVQQQNVEHRTFGVNFFTKPSDNEVFD